MASYRVLDYSAIGAISSAGSERSLHTREVRGSNPLSPTQVFKENFEVISYLILMESKNINGSEGKARL